MVTFTHSDKKSTGLSQRYKFILKPNFSISDDVKEVNKSKEYLTFLENQERKVGPNGFLDSKRYTYTYQMQRGTPHTRSMPSLTKHHQKTVVDLSTQKAKDLEDHEQMMKTIEDHMWQRKVEERALKREEGDVTKKQTVLKKAIHDYDAAAQAKSREAEGKIIASFLQGEKLKQKFSHKKEEMTKKHIHQRRLDQFTSKSQDQKSISTLSDLEKVYQKTMLQIQRNQEDLQRLQWDYEQRLKQREQEDHRLKKELAELAIAISKEAKKGQSLKNALKRYESIAELQHAMKCRNLEMAEEKAYSDAADQTRTLEANRRQLVADMAITKEYLNEQLRDETRRLLDTRLRLTDNESKRKTLHEATEQVDLNHKNKEIETKIEAHKQKRLSHLQSAVNQHVNKQNQKLNNWEDRYRSTQAEEKQGRTDDDIKHFQKVTHRAEEAEYHLFKNIQSSENSWKKQMTHVEKLQRNLLTLRKDNAAEVCKTLADVNKREQDLVNQINKATAELQKHEVHKKFSYDKLLHHRAILQEDKHILTEMEKV
ncbi:trichoplein keratin filament-binding protein-like [Protopterus annectens]|uniref:trichoplein keratin filament-binding protein-like n=1 Tax=Protopterus annectens TaxID=7888 RepID=UPI001CFAB554|nr:trichoplein keratin filament-binding protein-like [Protopterus annectens]